ncbi:MAG: AAA family ATPase [Paludibacter sp.]|nr:AAA family ATPase [Paludibacter sp.]
MDIEDFILQPKSMLIAPAGYGKTYTIASCLHYIEEHKLGKHLILTHTHAGIISIKEKLNKLKVSTSFYSVETITSFAQKFVLSFYRGEIYNQEDNEHYYSFIIAKATEIIKIKPITEIIKESYTGLFVDEYQDCTIDQHALILEISNLLKTHILGDPLQGIFSFAGTLVNLESNIDMGEFLQHQQILETPWRWKNGNNEELGKQLGNIRTELIDNKQIKISNHKAIETIITNDYLNEKRKIYEIIKNNDSVLFIDPGSYDIDSRIKFLQQFSNIPILIESIDDKNFYLLANKIDEITAVNVIHVLKEVLIKISNESLVKKWFNDKDLIKKQSIEDQDASKALSISINNFKLTLSKHEIKIMIQEFFKLPDAKSKCYRKDLFNSLVSTIEDAEINKISVYEAMVKRRNNIRRIGRKVYGKCIGTTLLTKGLEFDTVIVLNAHKFNDMKNLYVALTRASKNLIVFTDNPILSFIPKKTPKVRSVKDFSQMQLLFEE